MGLIAVKVLVTCPVNSHDFSVPYGACDKARLAGNGRSPLQEVQRGHKPRMARLSGALVCRHYGVAPLGNIADIPGGTRLVLTADQSSETMRINRTGH